MLLLLFLGGQLLPHPAGPNAAEAFLTTCGETLYMTWIISEAKHKGRLYMSSNDGRGWRKPALIREADNLFINWADYPKLLVLKDWMLAVWPEMLGEGTYSYGLRFSRSLDDGQTWREPEWLHEDRSLQEHGFVSLAALDDETAAAVWLDGRALADSGMQLRYRTLSAETTTAEILLDERTCECCNTDLVQLASGPLAVYRDRSKTEIRDIFMVRPGSMLEAKQPVFADGWEIMGCPVNGPALDARGNRVALAWFTGAGDSRLGLAVSPDGGKVFSKPLRFAPEAQGRLDCVWLADDQVAVSWIQNTEEGSEVRLARFRPDSPPVRIGDELRIDATPASRVSGSPRLAVWDGGLVIAYQDPDKPGIKLKHLRFGP